MKISLFETICIKEQWIFKIRYMENYIINKLENIIIFQGIEFLTMQKHKKKYENLTFPS